MQLQAQNQNLVPNPSFESGNLSLPLTAFPNPFTDEITFSFSLEREAAVRLELLDMTGRRVALLAGGELLAAGPQEIVLPGAGLPPGVYVARFEAGGQRQSLKVVKE